MGGPCWFWGGAPALRINLMIRAQCGAGLLKNPDFRDYIFFGFPSSVIVGRSEIGYAASIVLVALGLQPQLARG